MNSPGMHNPDPGQSRTSGDCPAFETLSAWFDHGPNNTPDTDIQNHVDRCATCQAVLQDFSTLRAAVRKSTPPVSLRTFVLDADALSSAPTPIRRASSHRTRFIPVAAAIAAVLVIALMAGELLFTRNDDQRAGSSSGNVLVINGTPFTDENNDAEFSAASAGDMNSASADARESSASTSSDEGLLTGWRVSQLFATTLLATTIVLWYKQIRRRREQ